MSRKIDAGRVHHLVLILWSVSRVSGLHPNLGMSSKIDAGRVHGQSVSHWSKSRTWVPWTTGGRIVLEDGFTLWMGSYSGGTCATRSRVGPYIKFGQIYKSVTGCG